MDKIVKKEELEQLRMLFTESCPSLPKPQDVEYWGAGRIDRAKRAIRRHGLERIGEVFRKVEQSDFLTGRNGRWGKCGIDWVLKPENFSKITEGNYDNRKPAAMPNTSYDLEEAVRKATITARKTADMYGKQKGENHV